MWHSLLVFTVIVTLCGRGRKERSHCMYYKAKGLQLDNEKPTQVKVGGLLFAYY